MTDEQIIKKFRKREKELGKWMAERGYDAWDVRHKGHKLCRYVAVTTTPKEDYIRANPCFGYNWDDIKFKKVT
jgi:hypothetical protein